MGLNRSPTRGAGLHVVDGHVLAWVLDDDERGGWTWFVRPDQTGWAEDSEAAWRAVYRLLDRVRTDGGLDAGASEEE